MIWRNFFSLILFYSTFLHFAQCRKTRNSLSLKTNQLFSKFFSKTIAFTNFLPKKCERKILQFPHCAVGVSFDFLLLKFGKLNQQASQIIRLIDVTKQWRHNDITVCSSTPWCVLLGISFGDRHFIQDITLEYLFFYTYVSTFDIETYLCLQTKVFIVLIRTTIKYGQTPSLMQNWNFF